jgi:hypothetical protein
MTNMKLFFIVLARDESYVYDKIRELDLLGVKYKIVCGKPLNHPNVVYRPPKGKYEAINFSLSLIPDDIDIVAMNDVDTKIHNLTLALEEFKDPSVGLVFGTEQVNSGPQHIFFKLMNPIRRVIPIAGSGELLLIKKDILFQVCPLKPCKAEDTYILFKVIQNGHKIVFCENCYAETERTKTADKEELYKRKTVAGIYQAIHFTKPPASVKLFYIILPIISPVLMIMGEKGYYWMRGILFGLQDFLRGDRQGTWSTDYMK